ncbi:MAG: rhomboid family intramembrane serine protease [Firmicutes bacterium]|nr:rhomboid family intramembrane serine protease [Bacillota bacterium]
MRRRVPYITLILCLLMLGGYALQQAGMSAELWQLVPQRFQVWSLLTTCFLHATPAHLLGNLLWLLLFGSMVEMAVRRYEVALVMLLGGMVASAVQMMVVLVSQPERAESPIVGASGMVAAVIGAFAVRFFALDVRVGKVSIPSLWIILLWLIPQLVGAIRTLVEGGLGTVGYWGHLGGFITGLVLALALRMTRAGARSYLQQQLLQAQSRGDVLEASRIAQAWCQLEPDSIQAHLTAARMALTSGDEPESLKHYQQSLALCEVRNDTKTGVDIFLESRQHLPTRLLPREMCLRWSLRAAQAGHLEEALEALRQLAESAAGTPEGENALLQSARITLQQLQQPDRAVALLERFLEQYPHSALTAYALRLLRQAQEAERK